MYVSQLDESILGDLDQCLQLFGEAFLFEEQVVVYVEFAVVGPWGGFGVVYLFAEDLSIDPSVEPHKGFSYLEELLSEQGVFLHGERQLPFVSLQ